MFTTVDEIGRKYGITNLMKIREALRAGRIQGKKVNGSWLVDAESAEAYFGRHTQITPKPVDFYAPREVITPKVEIAKPEETTVERKRNLIVVKGLKLVATAKRTNRRKLFIDGNGEWWTNAVHGNTNGGLKMQSEWHDEATGENLRQKFFREFGVQIADNEVIHITPCHAGTVARAQGEELLNHNILVEGDWDSVTWTGCRNDNTTLVIARSHQALTTYDRSQRM